MIALGGLAHPKQAVMRYSLFFHDHAGHVFSHADFSAIDNADAIDVARKLYRTGIGRGYEIWRTGHHIHTEATRS